MARRSGHPDQCQLGGDWNAADQHQQQQQQQQQKYQPSCSQLRQEGKTGNTAPFPGRSRLISPQHDREKPKNETTRWGETRWKTTHLQHIRSFPPPPSSSSSSSSSYSSSFSYSSFPSLQLNSIKIYPQPVGGQGRPVGG